MEKSLFGDLEQQDVIPDERELTDEDWANIVTLQAMFDRANLIDDHEERRKAVKDIIRQLNGEE